MTDTTNPITLDTEEGRTLTAHLANQKGSWAGRRSISRRAPPA
jgi:hypothetical protein